ncbi:MAG TPA: non-homologous end-joining DNA ligase [Gammaproteobacteria bacterium]|nr:non-homologous end-joining DNA ligase [Gammaproteobacteria bacterium]
MSEATEVMEVDGREIEITHADRELFPDDGFTKFDLAEYYRRISDVAVPHCRDRALTMQRFPDGIEEEGFFQKAAPDHFPEWIRTAKLKKEGGSITHVVANDAATLVYLANQGCITPHLSLFRIDDVAHPDRMIFDLDPSDDDFGKVRRAARRVKALLDELKLETFLQTTGSRGLHVVVPLERRHSFDQTRDFARRVGEVLEARFPKEMTVAQRKEKRGNLVFIDYLRNAYGQTAVAAYAVRAKSGAPVATPIDWEELDSSELDARSYNIENIFRRLGRKRDPWAEMDEHAQTLGKAEKRLRDLEKD